MKRYSMFLLCFLPLMAMSQTTYTWTGGAGGTGTDWTVASNWSPARTAPASNDVLVFDGSMVPTVALTNLPYQSIGSLTLKNSAAITIATCSTPVKPGGTIVRSGNTVTGTGTALNTSFIVGDFMSFTSTANNSMSQVVAIGGTTSLTTAETGTVGSTTSYYRASQLRIGGALTIGANSSLILSSATAFAIVVTTGAMGVIEGSVEMSTKGQRLSAADGGGINFLKGGKCTVSGTGDGYPFGQYPNNTTYNNVVFRSGSAFFYKASTCYSPFGVSLQGAEPTGTTAFQTGSTIYYNAVPTSSGASFFASRFCPNVVINANVAFDGTFYSLDTLTVNTGAVLTLNNSGVHSIVGNIVNNGSIQVTTPASCNLVMMGSQPQTIGGTGGFSLGALSIGSSANVTLQSNLTSNTVTGNILGQLDFNGFSIGGTASLNIRSALTATYTGTVTVGSFVLTNVSSTSNLVAGMAVTGAGVPDNTFISTVSGTTVTMTNAALANSVATALVFSRGTPVINVTSAAGFDGNFATTGTKTIGTASYVFNTATGTPFSGAVSSITANKVILKAPVTLNANLTTNDSLVMNNNGIAINGKGLVLNGVCNAGTGAMSGTGTLAMNGQLLTAHVNGLDGTFPLVTYTLGSSNTIEFCGSGAQAIQARADYYNLIISGDRGGARLVLPTGTIGVGNSFLPMATNVTYGTAGNTIDLSAAAPVVNAFAYNNLVFSKATTTPVLNGNATVNGTLSFSTNKGIDLNGFDLALNNGLSGIATFGGSSLSTLTLASSGSAMAIAFAPGKQVLKNLTVNVPSGLVLGSTLTINGTLTLQSGKILLGNNNMVLAQNATVNGANDTNYLIACGSGKLFRLGTTGASLFPIGTMVSYAPLTITPASATDIGAGMTGSMGSVTDPSKTINLSWSVSTSSATAATIRFQFDTLDFGSAFQKGLGCEVAYSGKGLAAQTVGVPVGSGPFALTARGLNLFSDAPTAFMVGNAGNLVNANKSTQWTGAVSVDWELPANWTNGVPDSSFTALVPAVAQQPTITAKAFVKELVIDQGASVANASSLYVYGHLTVNGTVNCKGSVWLVGNSKQVLAGKGAMANLVLSNPAGAALDSGTGLLVSASLSFDKGHLMLGKGDLSIGASALVLGASSSAHIKTDNRGALIWNDIGSSPKFFPIGTSGGYAPIAISSKTSLSTVSVSLANVVSAPVNFPKKLLNLQWTVRSSVASDLSFGFYFNTSDAADSFSFTENCETGQYAAAYTVANVGKPVFSSGSYSLFNPSMSFMAGNTYYLAIGNAGAFSTCAKGYWVGPNGGDANLPANWCNAQLPDSSTNVVIEGTVPKLTANLSVNGLKLTSGLDINGKTFVFNGPVYGTGYLIGSASSKLTANGTGTLYFDPSLPKASNLLETFTMKSSGTLTLGNTLYIKGTLLPNGGRLASDGNLVLLSGASGAARVAKGNASGNYISGNVTVQSFVPAKSARKYTFIASSVVQRIDSAWQKQIYITGPGWGGTICGGNGSHINNNGFDQSPSNIPSMFIYSPVLVDTGRWASVPSTNAGWLVPGKGYRINIRGDRNTGSCADQLNSFNPLPPSAVVLSAVGKLAQGDVVVPINDTAVHPFTLVANPYPCPIGFNAFQAANTGILGKMWTYSPWGNGNYSTYSNGIFTNAASGYDDNNGERLASGQAFFVESSGKSASVLFQENHKVDSAIPNFAYFGAGNSALIRVGLRNLSDSLLDEAVVRFNALGSRTISTDWDAASLSKARQTLAFLKQDKRLAIATLPLPVGADTIVLTAKSTVKGTFRLRFNEIKGFAKPISIILKDAFLGRLQDVTTNPVYDFDVTGDTLSSAKDRFRIILNYTVPLRFDNIPLRAKWQQENVLLEWTVAEENDLDKFEVQRSDSVSIYSTIASVPATEKKNYSLIDPSPGGFDHWYRLKERRKDGTSTIGAPVWVGANINGTITVGPNPCTGRFYIRSRIMGTFTLQISDMQGRVVLVRTVKPPVAINLPVTLPKTTYIFKMTDLSGHTAHERLFLVK